MNRNARSARLAQAEPFDYLGPGAKWRGPFYRGKCCLYSVFVLNPRARVPRYEVRAACGGDKVVGEYASLREARAAAKGAAKGGR